MFSMTFSNCQHNIPDREGLRAVSSRQLVRQQKTPDGLSGERWSGTESWWLLAERRRCRKTTSETGEEWSVRYRGAWSCWHRYTSILSLYFTRSGTSGQWSSLCTRWDKRARTFVCHWQRVQARSTLVEARLLQSSAPRQRWHYSS